VRADWPFAALTFESIADHTLGVVLVLDGVALAQSVKSEAGDDVAEALEWYQGVDAELARAESEVAILTSLAPQERGVIADREPLRAFVTEMIDALLALESPASDTPPRVEMAAVFGVGHRATAHLFALTVELEMLRPTGADDPDGDGWLVSTDIPAAPAATFATNFETTDFPEWRLAFLVTTAGREYWCVDDAAMQVVVGAMPEISGVPQPYYHAPRPIALDLVSFPSLEVPQLGHAPAMGDRVFTTLAVSDMDVDGCARRSWELIERLLGWKLAEPARGLPNASANAWMDDIAAAKHSLAVSMSALLTPTLEIHAGKGEASELQRVFFNRLRSDLRCAYTLGAVVQYPIGRVALSAAQDAPLAFGQVIEVGPDGETEIASAPYSLSTAAVALFATNPSLTFLVELKDAPPVSVDVDLRYRIGFLAAHGSGSAPWLQLVRPITHELGRATIPIPVRAHPAPPSLGAQYVELPPIAKGPVREQLFDARRWNFAFAYARSSVPHDNHLSATVRYEPKAEPPNVAPVHGQGSFGALAEALVAFDVVHLPIAEQLDRLPLVDEKTSAAELDAIAAALELMHYCVLEVAAAFQSHSEPDVPVAAPPPPPDGDRLEIVDVIGGVLSAQHVAASHPVAAAVGITSASVDGHSGRVVTVSGLDILQFQRARASLTQQRNRSLLGTPGQYATSKQFVYTSRPSSMPAGVVASRWVGDEDFDLAELVPAPRTIASVLSALFDTFVCALDGTPSAATPERNLSLSCTYEYEIIPAQDGAPPFVTQLPIMQTLAVALPRNDTAQLGQALASQIEAWLANRDANPANARLLFEVNILVPTLPGEGDTIALQLRSLTLAL
jgi:hypothetical protein